MYGVGKITLGTLIVAREIFDWLWENMMVMR